jgi:hypothetical protein
MQTAIAKQVVCIPAMPNVKRDSVAAGPIMVVTSALYGSVGLLVPAVHQQRSAEGLRPADKHLLARCIIHPVTALQHR